MHLVLNSLDYSSLKDRKSLAVAIKSHSTALTVEAALVNLMRFNKGHGVSNSLRCRCMTAGLGESDSILCSPDRVCCVSSFYSWFTRVFGHRPT